MVVEALNEMQTCLYASQMIFGPYYYVDLVNGYLMVNRPDAKRA